MSKDFHIGDILSITTGRMISPRHVDGIYDILGFMTGEQLWTHQLPRAGEICKPALLKQHPVLAEVDASGINAKNLTARLAMFGLKYGEMLPVDPLPPGAYESKCPATELAEMMGKKS